VLLFLILLVLSFFPYRRKRHHSKQAAESPGIASDELGHASIDAEKTTGKGHGGLTQHEQSEMPGVGIPVKQFVVAKDPVLNLEELTDARSSRFEVCTARIQFA
jgi:hypothetical protein